MKTLYPNQRKTLLEFFPTIRNTLSEWLLVEAQVQGAFQEKLSAQKVAEILEHLFQSNDGMILICNNAEVLMLVRWGKDRKPESLIETVRPHFADGSCEIQAQPPSADGITKLALKITPSVPLNAEALYEVRKNRAKPVFMIADDDMFQRALASQGLSKLGTVIEVDSGDKVESAYKQHNPDVLILDIHMPGRDGREVVYDISMFDSEAYIVMISADGSQKNIADTWQKGARDFLTKPFKKERLLECVQQCPTVHKS